MPPPVPTQTVSIQDLTNTSSVSFGTSGVRGLVSDMTDRLCYAYTKAFLQKIIGSTGKVVLGHDLRPSSPNIAAVCATAIQDMSYQVVYAGALPTPALAYYAAQLNAPCLVVTGSHIPFDRNGMKFYRANGEISKADEATIQNSRVEVPSKITPFTLSEPDPQAYEAYVQRYVDFFGKNALANMQIAIYEHSSVAREVLRDILQKLGATVISLGRTDAFVPIDTEAVRHEDVIQAKQWANTATLDAIVSTDGDGDRPLMSDELGHWIRGDIVGILCARALSTDTVVTPVSSNTAVELCGAFSTVIRTRIGSPFVITAMEEMLKQPHKTIAGYEANGGFLLACDITRQTRTLTKLMTRDAILPMLTLLCDVHNKGITLSQLKQTLPKRFTFSDRLQNFSLNLSLQLLTTLQQDLTKAAEILAPDAGAVTEVNLIDGLRLTFTNGDIVHLRPSGNAPELRCYIESETEIRAQQLCMHCLQQLVALSGSHPSSHSAEP